MRNAFRTRVDGDRDLEEGDTRTIHAGDDELRIRISGDDIIIERHPRGSHDDG
jgi:hypothetical protein